MQARKRRSLKNIAFSRFWQQLQGEKNTLKESVLLEMLNSVGIYLDKQTLETIGQSHFALQELTEFIVEKHIPADRRNCQDEDVVGLCVRELWKKWFPNCLMYEHILERVEHISHQLRHDKTEIACRMWYKTWPLIIELLDRCDVKSERDFQLRYSMHVDLLHLFIHVPNSLMGANANQRSFYENCIAYSDALLKRLSGAATRIEPESTAASMRKLLTFSYAELGDFAKVDQLLQMWIDEDPRWTDAWKHWAFLYGKDCRSMAKLERAEEILREAMRRTEQRLDLSPKQFQSERIMLIGELHGCLIRQANLIEGEVRAYEATKPIVRY